MSAFLHEIKKFFVMTCNSDSTFELSVLFHACHVYRGLESLKNYARLSLIAFANKRACSKAQPEPVLL